MGGHLGAKGWGALRSQGGAHQGVKGGTRRSQGGGGGGTQRSQGGHTKEPMGGGGT